MSHDPFGAIKVQLDAYAALTRSKADRAHARRLMLREALEEIANLKPDAEGNSMHLALRIANKALDDESLAFHNYG